MKKSAPVLIIEDDEGCVLILQELLNKRGINSIVVANTNQKAKTILEKIKPEIVFIDLILDNGDNGAELSLSLRQENYQFPIIFTTAATDDWIEKNLFQKIKFLEPCECLHKPIHEQKFNNLINKYLI